MDTYTFRGANGANVPHEPGPATPPGTAGPAGAASLVGPAGPAGAAGLARCGRTCLLACPRSQMFRTPRAQLGWTRLIKGTSVWSNGWSCDHLDQWVHLSGQSTATTIISRASWASLSKGGSSHGLKVGRPHLPTTIPAKIDVRNQPSTASGARIRSVQVKRGWIIGSATPLDPVRPMKMGPHAQPTSLAYKRSLTPIGSNTQCQSISLPLFSSLRVGLMYLGS
jgi:hypothetical protein